MLSLSLLNFLSFAVDASLNFQLFEKQHLPEFEYEFFAVFVKNAADLREHRLRRGWLPMLQVVQNQLDHRLLLNSKQLLDFVCNEGAHVFLKQIEMDQLGHVDWAIESRSLPLWQFPIYLTDFLKFLALLFWVWLLLFWSFFFFDSFNIWLLFRMMLFHIDILLFTLMLIVIFNLIQFRIDLILLSRLHFLLLSGQCNSFHGFSIILNLLLTFNFLLHFDKFLDF